MRSLWDVEKEEYYFSVVDVINALTDSPNPRNYWNMLKKKLMEEEKSELYRNCVQLKMKANDGKMRETDTLDIEGIFRLIESVPSPHAEPFKMWLATLGKERIDEVYDPEITVNRAISYYRNHGYSDEWIKSRLIGILDRHKLTDVWKENGINENYEYAILTNEIYKTWSGMKASEYKAFKGIRKESLRDNMTEVEVALNILGEIATKEIAKAQKPYGLEQNKKVAHKGGTIAKNAKESIEKETGTPVVSKTNSLNYQYIDELKQINEDNNKITN
ncbi:MAG: BRO family protein [Bacilli bacterium]